MPPWIPAAIEPENTGRLDTVSEVAEVGERTSYYPSSAESKRAQTGSEYEGCDENADSCTSADFGSTLP